MSTELAFVDVVGDSLFLEKVGTLSSERHRSKENNDVKIIYLQT
jgi:hypothetical protein